MATLSDKTYCMPYNTKNKHMYIYTLVVILLLHHTTLAARLFCSSCCLHCLKQFCKHLATRFLGLYIQQCRETCSIVITNGLQIKDPTNLLEMYRILPTLANDKWWIVFKKKNKKKPMGNHFIMQFRWTEPNAWPHSTLAYVHAGCKNLH